MAKKSKKLKFRMPARNGALFDQWSVIHCLTGVLMGWLISPAAAFLLMVLWEPFEIFVISPIVAKRGIVFGHETLRNSLSDIVFDALGVLIGFYLLTELVTPPFHLF